MEIANSQVRLISVARIPRPVGRPPKLPGGAEQPPCSRLRIGRQTTPRETLICTKERTCSCDVGYHNRGRLSPIECSPVAPASSSLLSHGWSHQRRFLGPVSAIPCGLSLVAARLSRHGEECASGLAWPVGQHHLGGRVQLIIIGMFVMFPECTGI